MALMHGSTSDAKNCYSFWIETQGMFLRVYTCTCTPFNSDM